jgi:hypothetical protein
VEHVIGGVPFVRDRDAEFAARGDRAKSDVLQVWKDVAGRVSKVLGALTPDRLAHVTNEKNKSVVEILLHVTHHNALHIGQIVWNTKLRRPGTIHELLRPAAPPSR